MPAALKAMRGVAAKFGRGAGGAGGRGRRRVHGREALRRLEAQVHRMAVPRPPGGSPLDAMPASREQYTPSNAGDADTQMANVEGGVGVGVGG